VIGDLIRPPAPPHHRRGERPVRPREGGR